MIKAIFTDLDGVIRHWDNQIIHAAEMHYRLPKGFLFQHAFAKALLLPTITGQQTHYEWNQQIKEALQAKTDADIAQRLISTWYEAPYSIDVSMIEGYKSIAPNAKLILVTNATDRLNDDLSEAQLTASFDFIINSSAIGFAKPDIRFYKTALSITGVSSHESLYIDDSMANVQVAQSLGFRAVHFSDREQTLSKLLELAHQQST